MLSAIPATYKSNDKTWMQSQMNSFGSIARPFLFLIDFLCQQFVFIPLNEVDPEFLMYRIGDAKNLPLEVDTPSADFNFSLSPISWQDYRLQFDQVMRHINVGDTYLINLTCPTPLNTGLSIREIFSHSRAAYTVWVKDAFVVFSPETFVQISDGRIYAHPMKGTIDASLPDAREIIIADPKELAEHYTIVDLIRNDLSMVAKDVRVENFRYIQEIKTMAKPLLQVSSKISGRLPENYLSILGDIIFTLLPAGSITGAPKQKTVEIILETEQYDRGFYTGICGIFDGESLDTGVMIRFIEQTQSGLVFKSGGGITSQSDARTEYQEMISKVYVPFF